MFPLLLLGALLGGNTAGIICSVIYSRSIETLQQHYTAGIRTATREAYNQGYQDRALLGLQPSSIQSR